MLRTRILFTGLLVLGAGTVQAAPATCVAGRALGFECERVDLVGRLDLPTLGYGNLNDVWGWTDPLTGTEYALVGAVDGTVFVDLSVPSAPRIVGRLPAHENLVRAAQSSVRCKAISPSSPGPRPLHDDSGDGCGGGSAWRNIKTYADHAFIGSEAAGHGLQVFDLRQLRDVPAGSAPQTFGETAHYPGFGNSHTLIIDEQSGFLYAVGSDTYAGGPHFVDVRTPAAPVAAGGWAGDGYTHEALCLVYAGPDTRYSGRQICLLSNEDTLTVLDVTDKSAPEMVSRTPYAESGYTHQGWLTADQRHLFVNDELDELDFDLRTRTLVWDLVDLRAPSIVTRYAHPTWVIDHNNYVRDGFVFQSNYTAGLVILDGRDPLNLIEVGYFDTAPVDDVRRFDGTWSNYPFFASGLVAVSDISGGLFVLRPQLPTAGTVDLRIESPTATGIVVRNAGATPATNVTLTLAVEGGPEFTAVSAAAGIVCELTPDVQVTGTRAARCRVPQLAAGGSLSFVFATTAGSMSLDAQVASDQAELSPADNRVVVNLTAGGGGGGAFGLLGLSLLGLAMSARRPGRRGMVVVVVVGLGLLSACASVPPAPLPELMNMRVVSPDLVTAGALREGELDALRAAGFDLVVDLRTAEEGVAAERDAAAAAGLRWVNVPVGRSPTRAQLDALSTVLEANPGARTLVHCASNRRASTLVMLHQVTREGRDAAAARADVEAVWTPSPVWQTFIDETLATPAR